MDNRVGSRPIARQLRPVSSRIPLQDFGPVRYPPRRGYPGCRLPEPTVGRSGRRGRGGIEGPGPTRFPQLEVLLLRSLREERLSFGRIRQETYGRTHCYFLSRGRPRPWVCRSFKDENTPFGPSHRTSALGKRQFNPLRRIYDPDYPCPLFFRGYLWLLRPGR